MLSIIICTYNREKYIYNVLKSIAANDYPQDNYEIVLINNNCTDNTEAECNRFMNDYPTIHLHYLKELNQGLSYARNCGIRNSQGDILVYVDDDALVNEEYLRSYADFFASHPDVDAAGGPIIPKYETKAPKWMSHYTKMLLTGYKFKGNSVKAFESGDYPGGGNAAYRATVFEKVGLFNVDLGRKGDTLFASEEKDIFDKMRTLGMKIYYIPTAILYHIIPEQKLSRKYFNKLTYAIGESERTRTKQLGKGKYARRLISEGVKWIASIILCVVHTLTFSPLKGWKLIQFRWNVTRGLLGK